MKSLEQIRENQKTLHDLAVAIDLWSRSTNATDDKKAKIHELYERLQIKLQELELQAQNVKIDTMLKVLALYKGDKDV
jgi:hypothetical protein